jgi:hypothetical protein
MAEIIYVSVVKDDDCLTATAPVIPELRTSRKTLDGLLTDLPKDISLHLRLRRRTKVSVVGQVGDNIFAFYVEEPEGSNLTAVTCIVISLTLLFHAYIDRVRFNSITSTLQIMIEHIQSLDSKVDDQTSSPSRGKAI